ncbi:MAG: response regulator [Bacteroidota bacterium]|nr:response regulator [Bacteroidota bacterium]
MKNALVVDDFRSIRTVVATILKKEGFTVTEAENGLDALKYLDGSIKFDIIISDVDMPVMGGIPLIKELRTKSSYKNTSVIMLTSNPIERKINEIQGLNIKEWLVKPFDYLNFKKIIEDCQQN